MSSTLKRTSGIAAILLVVSLVLTACGGSGGSTSTGNTGTQSGQQGKVKITVALPAAEGDVKVRQAQAEAFMKENPNISVELMPIPEEGYDEKVLTMIAGGNAPDIFGSGDVVIPTIVKKNYGMDLKPFVERDGYDLSDFYPQLVEALTYEGRLVGVADNWDTQVMYYNKNLFDANGLSYPTKDWTWDDFLNAARKITSGSGQDKIFGAIYDTWFAPVYDQIWSYGGEIYSEDGSKCLLDSPEAIAAIDSIQALFAEGIAPSPQALQGMGQESLQLFLSGRVGMLIGNGRWAAYDLLQVDKFDWAVAPIPKGPAGRGNFFHVSIFAIASQAKNPDAAWEFLKFMVSPEGMRIAVDNMQGIPSRQSVANHADFINHPLIQKHDSLQPFVDSLPSIRNAPYLLNFFKYQDQIDVALESVWSGEKKAADVLPAVVAEINAELAKNE